MSKVRKTGKKLEYFNTKHVHSYNASLPIHLAYKSKDIMNVSNLIDNVCATVVPLAWVPFRILVVEAGAQSLQT